MRTQAKEHEVPCYEFFSLKPAASIAVSKSGYRRRPIAQLSVCEAGWKLQLWVDLP